MLAGTNHSVFRKLPTKYWTTNYGSGDYEDRDYPCWKYSCEAGEYRTDSLLKLVYAIVVHRFSHFLQGNGFKDQVRILVGAGQCQSWLAFLFYPPFFVLFFAQKNDTVYVIWQK